MLNNDQLHYCKVMCYPPERAEEVLEKAVIMALFGELTKADEAFMQFNRDCERVEATGKEGKSFLNGSEFAVDYKYNGETFTVLHFEDEYGEVTLTSTPTGLNTKEIKLREEGRVRETLYKNSPESLKPETEVIVNFEKVFFSGSDWLSEDELARMVSQEVELPADRIEDNGHSRAIFSAKLVRESGHGNYEPENSHKGFNRGKNYTTGYAVLAIKWEMVEGSFVAYNPAVAEYTQPWEEVVRNFEDLSDKEKEMINESLSARFEE